MSKSTFKQDIEEAAGDGIITGIVLGYRYWDEDDPPVTEYDLPSAMEPHPPPDMFGRVIPWVTAAPWLDREYDCGYGSADCYSIWAWTASRVIFVSVYDGATGVEWVPRGPVDGRPQMAGGG